MTIMAKSSEHNDWLPPQAVIALAKLGSDLALARVRRNESLRAWAKRLNVSVSTLQRMESGDPGVGMGVYLAALWVIGRSGALETLARPIADRGALEVELRKLEGKLPKTKVRHG